MMKFYKDIYLLFSKRLIIILVDQDGILSRFARIQAAL